MRLAIFSDVHSNLPSLEAVLADIDTAGVNRGGEPQELSVTLTSRKLVDELAGVKSGAAGQ